MLNLNCATQNNTNEYTKGFMPYIKISFIPNTSKLEKNMFKISRYFPLVSVPIILYPTNITIENAQLDVKTMDKKPKAEKK